MSSMVAKHAGFCFGVERAVRRTRALAAEKAPGRRIVTLGPLIHNPQVVEELRRCGVEPVEEEALEALASETDGGDTSVIAVVRTHGVTADALARLRRLSEEHPGFSVEDCTCPRVRKIHDIVAGSTVGGETFTVIIGDAPHPEVQGICSFAQGGVAVCSGLEELQAAAKKPVWGTKQVIMVAQTTQKLTEWKKCQTFMRKVCTNAIIFDTICDVTETRQTEAGKLASEVDLMLVIGGRESSNTQKLYRTARQHCSHTYLIEDASEIPPQLITAHLKVGITAGASTPSGIIEEVKKTMDQNLKQTPEEGNEDFAGMLEESLKTLNTGETVKGMITSISSNEIHVDLGAKTTGVIALSEISDDPSFKIEDAYKVGDEIEAIVVKVSDMDGIATLSRKRIENIVNWRKIVAAYENNEVMEGKILDVVKGGVIILLASLRVFIPASQTGLPKEADLSTLVGTVQKVKIIEINEQRRRAVASIRAVLREERKAREAAFWDTIEEGKWYTGKVKSLTSYGAFVDLGGVDGMVHSSELSWKRIHHPSEVVKVGDEVQVYVKSFDRDARRISLGYKTEDTNPWTVFTNRYTIGDVATVRVVSMLPFGAFAEVVPGADGLIHISQIADHKITKPSDVLEIGQELDVKIIDIDMENHKISLSRRALLEEQGEEGEADAEDADMQ